MNCHALNWPTLRASSVQREAATIFVAVFHCYLEKNAYLCTMKRLKEELTEKMHSEFTVDKETDQKHRAGSVWTLLGFDASRKDIEHWASRYGVTYDICMKWKAYWRNLHQNNNGL